VIDTSVRGISYTRDFLAKLVVFLKDRKGWVYDRSWLCTEQACAIQEKP
jgi:hypothetical protein